MKQIRLINGLGSPPGHPGREVPARMPPAPRPGVRKTWEDVIYQQVAGRFCTMMERSGRTAGGPGRALGRQTSFAQAGWEGRARRARRAGLLDQTGSVVSWADLLALVGPPGTGAAGNPGPPRRCPGHAPRGAGRTCRASPARRLPRLALGPRPRGVSVPRARRHDHGGARPGQERVELARLSWTKTGPEGGVVKLQIKASSDYRMKES